jgi:hypothetical protein
MQWGSLRRIIAMVDPNINYEVSVLNVCLFRSPILNLLGVVRLFLIVIYLDFLPLDRGTR